MEVLSRHSSLPVNSYGGLELAGVSERKPTTTFGRPYNEVMLDVMQAVDAHATAHAATWLPLYHNVGDEPHGDAVLDNLGVAQAIAGANVSNRRTSVFTSFTTADDARAVLATAVDLLILNHHSAEAVDVVRNNSKEWMLYNQVCVCVCVCVCCCDGCLRHP